MPFRKTFVAPSPLEPLVAQANMFLDLLERRKEQAKEDERLERQQERQDEADAEARKAAQLEQAKTVAELARQGFQVGTTETEGGELREPQFPEQLFPGETPFGPSAPGGVPEATAQAVFGDELRRGLEPEGGEPIQLGGGVDVRFSPQLALEMARMSPKELLAEQERGREEDEAGQLADAIEPFAKSGALPAFLPDAIRAGLDVSASSIASLLRQGVDDEKGQVTPKDVFRSKLEAIRQAMILIRERTGNDFTSRSIEAAADEVAEFMGLEPGELVRNFRVWFRTGRLAGEEAEAPPVRAAKLLTPDQVDQARQIALQFPGEERTALLESMLTKAQAKQVLESISGAASSP